MKTAIKTKQRAGVAVKQRVRFGKPCLKRTRIAVADILNLLKAGYAIDEIPKQYPDITAEDVQVTLRYAAKTLAKEEIFEIQPA